MIEQVVSIAAVAVPVLLTQWFISNRVRMKIEESNRKREVRNEEAVQRRHEENQLAMQARQEDRVAQERLWRLEAEAARLKEQRACDDRIDQIRNKADAAIDGLRGKYDALYETYVGLLQEKGQLRVEVHDLRNELATFRASLL